MAESLQDTCISSSLIPHVSISDDSSRTTKEKMEDIAWYGKFLDAMCFSVGNRSYRMLESLLSFYSQNLSKEVETSYNYFLRTSKLLTQTNNVLMSFHLSFQEHKEKISDHPFYMDKMAEILTIYLDLTLKMFTKDPNLNEVSRILSSLFIFLDNSEEHIFRVLLGSKFINCSHRQIFYPMFMKCFSYSAKKDPSKDTNYVRYLLALRLWKEIEKDIDGRLTIDDLALTKLGDKVPTLSPELEKIIPQPPKVLKEKGTLWLMRTDSLNLRKACDEFVRYENESQNKQNRMRTLMSEILPKEIPKEIPKEKKIVRRVRLKRKISFIDLTIDDSKNGNEPKKGKVSKDCIG